MSLGMPKRHHCPSMISRASSAMCWFASTVTGMREGVRESHESAPVVAFMQRGLGGPKSPLKALQN